MRFNDLEAGFEKHLALVYGKHIITGHPIEHSVGVEGGSVADAKNRIVLKVALGDGAPEDDGEGAWCGPSLNPAPVSVSFVADRRNYDFTSDPAQGQINPPDGVADGDYLLAHTLTDDAVSKPAATPAGWTKLEEQVVVYETGTAVFTLFGKFYAPGDATPYDFYPVSAPVYMDVIISAWRGVNTIAPVNDSSSFGIETDGSGPTTIPVPGITTSAPGCRVIAIGEWRTANVGVPVGFTGHLDNSDTSISSKAQPAAGATGTVEIPLTDGTTNDIGGGFLVALKPVSVGVESGDPCSMEVIYGGETIPPEKYHFHPGTLSTGKDDPIQGVDSFFPNGQPYSGTAYLTVILPDGIEGDADPSRLAVIAHTSQVGDYNEDGERTAIEYSPNPSRVKANMLRRTGQLARLYWPSYVHSRDFYSEEIEAPLSTENTYAPFDGVPEYEVLGPVTANAGTGAYNRTSGSGYDNRAVTKQRIVGGEEGSFGVTLGGSFPIGEGGGEVHLVDAEGTAWFGVSWGNGHLGVLANSVPIEDATAPFDLPAVAGDDIELVVDDGLFVLKQNGVVKSIPQGEAPAPEDVDLFGRIVLWADDAAVTASHFVGKEVSEQTETTRMVPRFEAHPAFTGPVDLGTALDFVDSLCASDTQDAGRYIVFLTPEPRASVHTFDDEINVVGGSVRVRTTDIRNRPNRLWAKFRNLDLRYLDQDSVFDTRDGLFDKVGRPIDPGPLNFGSMNGSQAQRVIRFEMRRRSDNKVWCELIGMDDSWKVLPGDVVTVISREFDRVPKLFLVISATRESAERIPSGLQRNFVLQEYFEDDYRDDDHEQPQPQLGTQPTSAFSGPPAPVLQLTQEVAT